MKKIFKYPITSTGKVKISLPKCDRLLSVHPQDNHVVFYALVDDETSGWTSVAELYVVETGKVVEDLEGFEFLGTVALHFGMYVLHVFGRILR